MGKKRAYFMISLSVLMGVVAAWMARNYIQAAGQGPEQDMVSVVAADLALPFGTTVEARHVKLLQMPAEYVPPGSYDSIDDVIGLVTMQPIVSGEILMKARFADNEEGSTLAALISEKMRAVTVRVDDVIGVAGFLLPGNKVDVLASRREDNRRATAETILRDVKVLAVDQTAATEKNEPVIVRAVTLEVSPQQAEVLFKSREEGSIQLTLRNPLDDFSDEELVAQEEPEPAPIVEEPVAEVHAAPAPAPAPRRVSAPPTPSFPVTIIRGTSVTKEKASS